MLPCAVKMRRNFKEHRRTVTISKGHHVPVEVILRQNNFITELPIYKFDEHHAIRYEQIIYFDADAPMLGDQMAITEDLPEYVDWRKFAHEGQVFPPPDVRIEPKSKYAYLNEKSYHVGRDAKLEIVEKEVEFIKDSDLEIDI